jgi:uncharacterized membrane-anchored protein YhcB (DUF1043 family)
MFSAFSENFKTDLISQSTTRLSELLPVVALVVGILLAFLIIRAIVNMAKLKKGNLHESDDDEENFDDEPIYDEEW